MAKATKVKTVVKKKIVEEKKKGKTKIKEIDDIKGKDNKNKEIIFREILIEETSGLL